MSNLLRRCLLASISTSALIAVSLPLLSASTSSSPISSPGFSSQTFPAQINASENTLLQRERIGIADIKMALDSGLQNYEQLIRAYLSTVAANDNQASDNEPSRLNAMPQLNSGTLEKSKPLDQRRLKDQRSPSHDTAISRKKNINSADTPTAKDAAISKEAVPRDAYE